MSGKAPKCDKTRRTVLWSQAYDWFPKWLPKMPGRTACIHPVRHGILKHTQTLTELGIIYVSLSSFQNEDLDIGVFGQASCERKAGGLWRACMREYLGYLHGF